MARTPAGCSTITWYQVILKPAPENVLDLYLGLDTRD